MAAADERLRQDRARRRSRHPRQCERHHPAQRRQPQHDRGPRRQRRRRGALRRQCERRPSASRRHGSRACSHPAAAGEGVRAAYRGRGAGAIGGRCPRGAGGQSAGAEPRRRRRARRRSAAAMVTLDRGMGLLQATATNIIGMVGVGPFLTIPFMVTAMGGPHIVYAWAFGAVLALCDGLVYAELGAALPGSGGPYVYLREAYRPFGLGRLMAFIFVFQVMLVAPLSIAGGAVGFADYLGFYWATMTGLQHNLVAAAVCVAVTLLLYRDIRSVGRLSVVMLAVVMATVGWVIVAGLFSVSWAQAFDFPPEARQMNGGLLRAMAAAGLLAMYNYGGYSNVCNIGEEIRTPQTTLPRSIVLSIVIVVVLYVVMSTVILGMV